MNGGKDREGGGLQGQTAPVQVPIGWQRKVDPSGVHYISPSGSVLSSQEQVKTYLLTDGTCKCGLECPLLLPRVFNFDPGAAVQQRTAEDVRADEDVTKLCIHKRKLLAVATLHKSMETHPSLTLTSPGGGTNSTAMASTHSTTQRAIRNRPQEALPNSGVPDCKNPFKMMMVAGQQRHYPQEMSGSQQHQDLYPGYPRQQVPKSPYRLGYGAMLTPPSSSSQLFGEGSLSPRTDSLGSPDRYPRNNPCGFLGGHSPGPGSIHGSSRTRLSPPTMLLHGSPAAQPSFAMAGRTSTPLSPTATAKSPVMNKPRGNFPPSLDMPRMPFHHKTQPAPHPGPPPAIPPSCALQKKQMTSEKDPLGILDPIPSKSIGQSSTNSNTSNFQPSIHSQVPMMNVNIPPAIVPLPSNLPLPTVKLGPMGHSQRTHQTTASMSPSPVTSPVHMAGPPLGRIEASPHRSRSSSTSSDHGNFVMPSGPQAPGGSIKVPPRSPRSAMGSPRPAMPSSPSAKPDALHQYKDTPSQLLSGMSNTISTQHNPMYPPTSGTSAPQKGHPGLLGMPLNQILNQQNAASFPASSLLSAAAKAQLANQNKLSGNSGGGAGLGGADGLGSGGGNTGGNSSSGHPGPLGAIRSAEGHSSLNPMLPPNSTMLLTMSEGQSGRAALRDKLMAQQRDPLRKRKQANSTPNHDSMVYNMLNKPAMGGPMPNGPAEQLRKAARLGGLPPNTSMAQLLQSMSCQGSHMAGNHRPGPAGPGQMHYSDGHMAPAVSQQSFLSQQRLLSQGDGLHCQTMDLGGHSQFPGMMSQMQAASLGNCGPLGPGGPGGPDGLALGQANINPPPLSHPSHHPQQQTLLHSSLGHTNQSAMAVNSNDRSCGQPFSNPGDPTSLNCGMRSPRLVSLQLHHGGGGGGGGGQVYQHHSQAQHQSLHHQSLQGHPRFQGSQVYSEVLYPDCSSSSNSMACLYQNYQAGMASLPEPQGMLSHPQFGEARGERPGPGEGLPPGGAASDRLPAAGGESVDAIYRAVVDAASKGMHVVITTTVSGTTNTSPVPALSAMSAFTASIGDPLSLPGAAIHSHRGRQEAEAALSQQHRARQARPSLPQNNPEQGKSTGEGPDAHGYFRSPGCGTPRGQWEGEAHSGLDGHGAPWGGEEFLECSTQVRSSPCVERPAEGSQDHGPPLLEDGFRFNACGRTPTLNYKERLEQMVERCAHANGGAQFSVRSYADSLGPHRQELTGDDQSPSSSTSLEGPLAKEYGHYNGHFNGCAPSPSDTKSLSSEEDLRHPDSPSSELLQYRPRSFNMRDLVWGGFPSWPGKLAGEEQVHNTSLQLRDQGKVEPEKLKTLTHDLEALERATKRNRKVGKLNNHLEAAIHEAMSELDKMSGTVHQLPSRDKQVKLPKPKRRKISR
ncbi:methyl-CpG-binding domain protein 5-like isoform X2 [Hypomesus transpacificus]|uniref:methyl-CpG-binding domain protein 5-like isoform X2 n=1 Tax=Hypomesus transpacificus TaxID=137520 RepID=UPI001F074FD5|nr:methyl-CpG-binding domain protein 5-like isoform X2 [Hypomesus transpacificus]